MIAGPRLTWVVVRVAGMWVESSEQSFTRSLEEELQAVLADKADLQASVAKLQVPHEEGMMGTQSPTRLTHLSCLVCAGGPREPASRAPPERWRTAAPPRRKSLRSGVTP